MLNLIGTRIYNNVYVLPFIVISLGIILVLMVKNIVGLKS